MMQNILIGALLTTQIILFRLPDVYRNAGNEIEMEWRRIGWYGESETREIVKQSYMKKHNISEDELRIVANNRAKKINDSIVSIRGFFGMNKKIRFDD